MKYKIGDRVEIKKQSKKHYSKEFIDFLQRHNYKLTISKELPPKPFEQYLVKEMQDDSYFKNTPCHGSYIECMVYNPKDAIKNRFEILDL